MNLRGTTDNTFVNLKKLIKERKKWQKNSSLSTQYNGKEAINELYDDLKRYFNNTHRISVDPTDSYIYSQGEPSHTRYSIVVNGPQFSEEYENINFLEVDTNDKDLMRDCQLLFLAAYATHKNNLEESIFQLETANSFFKTRNICSRALFLSFLGITARHIFQHGLSKDVIASMHTKTKLGLSFLGVGYFLSQLYRFQQRKFFESSIKTQTEAEELSNTEAIQEKLKLNDQLLKNPKETFTKLFNDELINNTEYLLDDDFEEEELEENPSFLHTVMTSIFSFLSYF